MLHNVMGLCCCRLHAECSIMLQAQDAVLFVLAIAILSVRLSVTRVDQSKAVQARITKSSPSAAWKTLVLGTLKLFHKFKKVIPNEGAKWEGVRKICDIQPIWRCQSEIVALSGEYNWDTISEGLHLVVGRLAPSDEWLCFTGLSVKLAKSRADEIYMDEVYASLAYDGAPLLRVPVCVSRALLVVYMHSVANWLFLAQSCSAIIA